MTTTSGASSRTARSASVPFVALADDLHALLLEQVAQTRPEQVVVVHEQDARDDGLGVFAASLSWAYLGAAGRVYRACRESSAGRS